MFSAAFFHSSAVVAWFALLVRSFPKCDSKEELKIDKTELSSDNRCLRSTESVTRVADAEL